MNDLFKSLSIKSWRVSDLEMNSLRKNGAGGASTARSDSQYDVEQGDGHDEDLNVFFKKEQRVRSEIKNMQRSIEMLRGMNEEGKNLTTGRAVKEHAKKMEEEIKRVRQNVHTIRDMLMDLMKDNEASAKKVGCGNGTPTFKTRQNVTEDLRHRLQDRSKEFQALVDKINGDERDMTKRRYITITGETPDESTIEKLSTSVDRERFLRAAVQGQGKENLKDFLAEIEERSRGVQGLIEDLVSLQQVFIDMAALVEAQSALLANIESSVDTTTADVSRGVDHLKAGRQHQLSTRKWRFIAFLIAIIIAAVLALIIYLATR